MEISIRSLMPQDADDIERLYRQSAEYLRSLGDETDFQFNAQVYQRDGFGDRAAFSGIGAILNGELVGYLLYTLGYDTDRAIRYLFVIDLLVDHQVRQHGIGKALMRRATSICREVGGSELFWAVHKANHLALKFYEHLGADEVLDLRFMRLKV